MVRPMDIRDTVLLTEKKLALEKELSGLQRKSRVQRNRKTYYQREKEKRLSVEMRSLEWLHEYYSCRPQNSSLKDEVNSVVTEEITDISDADIDSEPEVNKKTAAQSDSEVQRKSKHVEPKTICSITNEKQFANKKEFSEIILQLGQSVHNPQQANRDNIRKKFVTIEKYIINAAYPMLQVQNKENPGNNLGENSQENKRKALSNRAPINEEKKTGTSNVKKSEKQANVKNNKKLEPKVVNNSKKPSSMSTQSKIDEKSEIKARSKKVKGSEMSVNTNSKDDVKPKIQTPALKRPPIGLQNKNELKVKRKSLNTQNTSCETKSEVVKTTRKFESSVGNSKSSLGDKSEMEPAKRDKSVHRAPAKLPETTDVSMKRLLQKQFESKLKAALPTRAPKSAHENELAKKTSTKKNVQVKPEEKSVKKTNAKSMQVKAKVNSWNKEYVQYVQLKAASQTENKLKVASATQSVDKKRSLDEEPKNRSVSKVNNKAKLTTWARLNEAKNLTEKEKAKVEVMLKNTNLEVKDDKNQPEEAKVAEIKLEEKHKDNDEEEYKPLVLDEIKDSEIILEKIPTLKEESSDTTLKAEIDSQDTLVDVSEANLTNVDLQENREEPKRESNATHSKVENTRHANETKTDKQSEDDSNKFPPYFPIELSPNMSVDSLTRLQNVQTLIKAKSNSEILKMVLKKNETPGPSGLSKSAQRNTSEIVLEKKAEVILKKCKESNDIVVKQLEQKEPNKGAIDGKPQAEGSKKLSGWARGRPNVEVIFAQKIDTKYNSLVEKLLDYRIDLIDQSLANSNRHDEISKPSITYI